MTGDVMDLLQYTFFQHALLGSLLASIACGIIGTYIVTRRLVFISGGITHASFGGIGLGLFAGISPILSAAVFSVLSAFGVEWLSRRKDMRRFCHCSILDVRDGTRNYVQLPVTGICARPVGLPLRQYTDHQPNRLMDARHIGTHTDRILLSVYPPYRIYCL